MKQFLRVPQRVHNAVMLMTDLASEAEADNFISLADVAERNMLSRGFLEEVVVPLKESGLVDAKRGSHGGYRLSRDPEDISIGDIVTAVEGPLALVDCLGGAECAIAGGCASKKVWRNVQRHIEDSLYAISLIDVMNGN